MLVGRVRRCRRYPVKSMGGEELSVMPVEDRRVAGDRMMGVFDEQGRVLTAGRTAAVLLQYTAQWIGDPLDPTSAVVVTLPDGTKLLSGDPRLTDSLSADLGQPVDLRRANKGVVYQKTSGKQMPVGTLADRAPVHLVTTASLNRLRSGSEFTSFEDERFRYNFLIETEPELEGFVEDGWLGAILELGQVHLGIETLTGRCVVTNRAQKDLAEDTKVLTAIKEANHGNLGVRAQIIGPGMVAVGCKAELIEP